MLDVIQAIKSRKSVRNFLDKKVEKEIVTSILEMARIAPSFFNCQDWRFVVVQDKQTKRKLVNDAKSPSFVAKSPIVIVGCGKPIEPVTSSDNSSYIIDTTIALDHVTLAAVQFGLGSCWINIFDEKKVKEILDIPEEIRVIALISLGYPKDVSVSEKKRKHLTQLIKFEKW